MTQRKAKTKKKSSGADEQKADSALVTLLQNNLIAQLAIAGVDNQAIARIVGVHVTRRVGPIASAIKKAKRDS